MTKPVLCLLGALVLAGCTSADAISGATVQEVVVTRGADPRGASKVYVIRLDGEDAVLGPGETLRRPVPVGRYTLSATTEPPRIDLRALLDAAPLDRASMPLTMFPGRQAVVEVETGPLGGPRLMPRPGARVD